jgi:hypothetical protein
MFLHELRMEMMIPSAEPPQADGEVQDISDALARPRGRPKTRAIPNAAVPAAKANEAVAMSHDQDQDIVLFARIAGTAR